MAGNTGLYYPWINFRDDDWVKLSLLFWKRLERIVPPSHPTTDTSIVAEFVNEGLIRNIDPTDSSEQIADRFASVVERNEAQLRERFGVQDLDGEHWAHGRPTAPFAAGDLVYIHVSKVAWPLQDVLAAGGLSQQTREGDGRWLGVHPEIARVYMTLLADEIAEQRMSHPVSESAIDFVCGGGWSVEALSSALLATPAPEPVGEAARSPAAALAFAALRTVIPADLRSVPVPKILEVRSKYGEELLAFRDSIQSVANDAGLAKITDPDAFQAQLQDAYDDRVAPWLPALRKDLQILGIATAEGWLGVKLTLPPIVGTGIAGVANDEVVGATAILLGLAGTARAARAGAQTATRENPAAYMLRLDHDLNVRPLRKKIGRTLQKLLLGA